MRRGARHRVVGLLSVIGITAVVAICTTTGGAQQLVKVRYGLATAPPAITTVSPYFALDQGYFKAQGLDVEVVPLPGSVTVVRALLSGQVDIALTDPATAFLAYANGAPIKIISGPIEKGTDVVVATAAIKTVADLRGKNFAISDPGGQQNNQIKLLASKYGVNPNDIQFLPIGGPVPRSQALLLGRVDATSLTIAVLKPMLDAVDQGKVHVIASMATEFPDLPTSYDLTTDQNVKAHAQVLARLVLADIHGWRWAVQNPDAASQVVMKYVPGLDPSVVAHGQREISMAYGINGGVTVQSVQGAQDLLVKLGVLRATVEVNQVLAPQFISLAMGSLGYAHR